MVDALAELGCSVTAREIADLLEAAGRGVGLASIYRALELLERLRLVQRVEWARAWPATSRPIPAASTIITWSATAAAT